MTWATVTWRLCPGAIRKGETETMNATVTIRLVETALRVGGRAQVLAVAGALLALGGGGLLFGESVPDEAAISQQIKELMRDPAPSRDRGDYMTVLGDRREKVIALVDVLLDAHPQTQRRDELLMAKLESLYIVAVTQAQPLDALAAEAGRILADKPSPELAAYAAYMKMRTEIATHRRKRRARALASRKAPTTTQTRTREDRFEIRQYTTYVSAYPKSEFTPSLLGAIIRDAWARGDTVTAQKRLAELKRLHPRHVETERVLAADRTRRAIGEPFELTFTSTAGERIDIQEMKGHVVVVVFWATWCANCRQEIRRLDAMHQRLRSRGLRVVGVSLDDSRPALEGFMARDRITWPVHFDGKQWDSDLARRFGIRAIPAVYVIDKSGVLRAVRSGDIESLVERLLEKNPLERRPSLP